MNLILLFEKDFISPERVRLTGRRLEHVAQIHRAQVGDSLRVGLCNREIGTGEIVSLDKNALELKVNFDTSPPSPLPVTLILALPRPRVLGRTLIAATSMGVKEIYLIHSNRVEKSYWHSPVLSEKKLQKSIILGLEQSMDTILPIVKLRNRFRPFVEDELPKIAQNKRKIIAHPTTNTSLISQKPGKTVLIIGPEGGFVPFELAKFAAAGFEKYSLGKRILRVETAVPVLLAKLF